MPTASTLPVSSIQSDAALEQSRSRSTIMSNHKEEHKTSSELVRDCIIGMADGLTVPFALTAGLSALGSSKLVVIGGLAELFSGAISMGLGAYLASVTEKQHYEVEEARERREVNEKPEAEEEEIYEIFDRYGVRREASVHIVDALKQDEDMWVQVRVPPTFESH